MADISRNHRQIDQLLREGMQHQQAGRLPQAEAQYREILRHDAQHADALHLMGLIAFQSGAHDAAAKLMRRAIASRPHFPEAYCNLATTLQAAGQSGEAIAAARQAIALRPTFSEAFYNLANALRSQRQFDDAIAAYHEATRLRPNFAEAFHNLGTSLKARGRLDEAAAAFGQAIALRPNFAEAHYNLGNTLTDQSRSDAAIGAYRKAIALRPDYFDAYNNLGNVLVRQGFPDEAAAVYSQALGVRPHDPAALHNLGNAFKDQGRLNEAIAAYRQALATKPDFIDAHSSLVYALCFQVGTGAQAVYEEARRWNEHHARKFSQQILPFHNDPDPDRPLRIGYVSPNFRLHTNGLALLPLLKAHDHSSHRITCYSDVPNPDSITEKCRNAVDQWRDIAGQSDDRIAQQIREDNIDILVDLASHMADNRLLVFARKPAPVQVTFLGHQSTSGLDTVDYRLSDLYVDPLGRDDRYYTEKVIRLPECYLVFEPLPDSPPAGPAPVVEAGYVTFGSLNNFCKVTGPVLELWSSIMAEVPNSKLILRCPSGQAQHRVRNTFAQHGIDPSRLNLRSEWFGARDYLRLHHAIDIYLDTFPHSGHTTSMDALWMGVPLITLAGETAVGGGGVFLLANLGLHELIAGNGQEYIAKAVSLARDIPRLKQLHATLRQRMQQSPLMDAPKYARNIEAAYRRMWRNWCTQQ